MGGGLTIFGDGDITNGVAPVYSELLSGISANEARPSLRAYKAAWVRLARCSLLRMLLTWVWTVSSEMTRRSAISLLLWPWATRRRISSSRAVSGSGVRGFWGGSDSSLSNLRATEGCNEGSPR